MTADDHVLAERLAATAGRHLLELRERSGESDPTSLRKQGDRTSHELLLAELGEHRPEDSVLSEEGTPGPVRDPDGRVWIVDPLDGTREFGELGRSDWAVHVALAHGEKLVAGAVALPAKNEVLSTANALRMPTAGAGGPRIAVSRSRPPAFVADLAERVGGEMVPMGSAGAKIAAVALGIVDAYVHGGGQYEWDSAAPVAVARAVGMHTSRLDGSELVYNQPNPWLPDLLVCRPELADQMLLAIAELHHAQEA